MNLKRDADRLAQEYVQIIDRFNKSENNNLSDTLLSDAKKVNIFNLFLLN